MRECGGLLYLSQQLEYQRWEVVYPLLGNVPLAMEMTQPSW